MSLNWTLEQNGSLLTSGSDSNIYAGATEGVPEDAAGSMPLSVPVTPLCTVVITWDILHAYLKWGWLLHVYGFASLFFVLAFYAFFSILNLRSLISSRPFMATINGFLCLLGACRAAALFIDPYGISHIMPKSIGSLLWDVGFPFVTSAFCLIQLAFLQLTQLNVGPKKFRSKSCLSMVITAHFSCVIGTDIAVAFHDQFLVAKYIFQLVFILWGFVLCGAFLYAGHRVRQLIRSVPSGLLACGPLDTQHKGIMQLAMLAPYSNLASSVAAALVPTLLAPKICITDENEQTFSYAIGGNVRSGTGAGANTTHQTAGSNEHATIAGPSSNSSRNNALASTGPQPKGRPQRRLGSEDDDDVDAVAQQSCSLLSGPPVSTPKERTSPPQPDCTIHTVLNYIAHVSRSTSGEESLDGRKEQVHQVLYVTTATAIMGLLLCTSELVRIIGVNYQPVNEFLTEPVAAVWPWFLFQTMGRILELAMGCAMAAVTKQPVVRPSQPFGIYPLRPKPTLYM